MLKASVKDLNHLLGNIDIYLLDQILKTRFEKSFKILDAGCGEGRNLIYFVRNGYQVWGIDKNADVIQMLKYLIKSINKAYPIDRFAVGEIDDMPYPNDKFDAIISSAVIHFAENKRHFLSMISETVRILKPGGILFARMASDARIENLIKPIGDGKYIMPDGSARYLLIKQKLPNLLQDFGLEFIEPFKTVIVDNKRSMSTLVLKKI